VGVSIPVDGYIPGSSKSLSVGKSKDSVEVARINLETTLVQARQDIVNTAKNVQLLWHAVEISKLNETIAERAYQLSQEGYRAGLVSQTDMENSRQQMVSAQLSGSTSQSQYLVGVGNLANALGLQVQDVYGLFGN
jgi:multidrug efflux system outer membrane protein